MRNELPPRVGISTRARYGDPQAPGSLRTTVLGAETALIDAIVVNGGMPLLLPYAAAADRSTQRRLAWHMIEGIDALLLQGGADVSPASYGASALRPQWQGDALRDGFETDLIEAALQAGKPVLGLCRGCQLLNVAFGGSLFQDLPSLRDASIVHSDPSRYADHVHRVRFARGGWLNTLYTGDEALVSSAHHQGIDRLGSGLIAEAWCSDDGLVEAIRAEQGWVVGVQWHPELHAAESPLMPAAPLFSAFLAAATPALPRRMAS